MPSRKNFPNHKEARQERAAKRQAISEGRTPAQRLKRLDEAGYVATKERAKIQKAIDDMNEKKAQNPKES